MSKRPTADEYFLRLALITSTRSTCARRAVGCLLVDERNHVLATGYNGPPSGFPHCIETPCEGAYAESGSALSECEAIHAEMNALLQCRDVYSIKSVYCSASPCNYCIRHLLNTSAERIVFQIEYPHVKAKQLWLANGREWLQVNVWCIISKRYVMRSEPF